jgi:hypothetical protein
MNPTRIIDMASAFYDSCVLFSASDLGIFATLAGRESASASEIAASCGLDIRGATLLLDACTALELLIKEGERYRNTPEATLFLVPGARGDLSKAIRYNRDVYAAWQKLPAFVTKGAPVERPQIHLGEDEERTRAFVHSMHGRALGIGRAVVPHLDLTGRKKLFDVGGGPGTYSVLIAQANPQLHCTFLDLPGIVNVANTLVEQQGMAGRVTSMAGDYHHTSFPKENDVVIFFGVLHQESPAAIRDLFRRAYDSLVPGGMVVVLDMMTDATHTRPRFSALFAVNMALTTENGWVFSDQELGEWLTGAGFAGFACRPLPPPMPHWLATAVKPAV